MPDENQPLLSRGLAVAATDAFLVVQGAKRHVFSGRSATLLLRLLPLLDGTRRVDDLARELDAPAAHIERSVEILAARGLLECSPVSEDSAVPGHVLDHHARTLDLNGGHRGTADLLDVLATAAVHITGPAGPAAAIAADLRECGVLDVTAGPPTGTRTRELATAARALALVVEDGTDGGAALARVTELCGPAGVMVLRAATADGVVEIGPRFLPDHTACSACFRHGHADIGRPAESAPDAAAGLLLVSLATAEAFALVAGAPAQPATVVGVTATDGRRAEQFFCVPRPACDCDDSGGSGPYPDLVDVQLRATEHSGPSNLSTGDPPSALRREARRLVADRPPFHAHPRHPLPSAVHAVTGTFGDAPPPRAPAAPGLDLLADLLARTAGLRPDPGGNPWQRWAPTGGQLASVELYLATRPGAPELPGTLFRYDDLRHALIPLRADTPDMEEVLAGTDLAADGLDVALVCTAAHHRVAGKYREFAYRLTHLDAGCATTQLAAAAAGHGLGVRFATRWDDSLADLLDLTPDGQYVTAVAGLHRGETCR